MKLLHPRALLAASRSVRSCRESGHIYTKPQHSISSQYLLQQCRSRAFTTKSSPAATPSSTTDSNQDEQPSLSTQVRLLMRRAPYPVAIITSTDPNPPTASPPPTPTATPSSSYTSQFRGMTVSSFNTVTLTPQPVISFNVRRPSETLHALLSSGRFLVHLLATNQATASLARDFARGNQNLALGEGMFEFVGVKPSSTASETGTEIVGAKEGEGPSIPPLPMLRQRKSTDTSRSGPGSESNLFPFIFECRLLPESVVDVYDHTIVVGTIVRAITSSSAGSTCGNAEIPSEDLCLTYANTKFWEIGKEVV
ncbi:flavin reductase family protein [Aspergillus mulundensis]|uniref:Flavin reductase like domain-containing protein n=1 Tax=Aspergillus mulundensis TaxID=1810919 RepID=A0A3D8T6M3_9EURO|nr:hypothetical protein DSM5745_01517 [Aspergillus mulundensis]RDW94195.1 hypothetical protein DSM5745_01517 [Aspergillus mulundensis]